MHPDFAASACLEPLRLGILSMHNSPALTGTGGAAGVGMLWLLWGPSCSCTEACGAARCLPTACWWTIPPAQSCLSTTPAPVSGTHPQSQTKAQLWWTRRVHAFRCLTGQS